MANGNMGESQRGRSLYYHRYSSALYGGTTSPTASASGGSAYGAPAYGGAYGASQAGSGEDAGAGAMSIGRIVRVCTSHWMTIFIFLVLGLLAAFMIYQLLPQRYQATAYYEMTIRGSSMIQGQVYDEGGATLSLREVFNTRKAQFDTDRVRKSVIDYYRTEHAASSVSTEELLKCLKEYEMDLMPMSRLVQVTIESNSPTLSADLANAYVATVKKFMDEENKRQSEMAVAWLTATLDNEEHVLAQLDTDLLDLRKTRQVEARQRERENAQARLSALDTQIITLDASINRSTELLTALSAIKEDPTAFGTMPESIPRSSEIVSSFAKWQDASTERKALLTRLTDKHPDVKLKAREEEVYRQQFLESAQRAYATGKAELELLKRQREPVSAEAEALRARLIELDTDIIGSEMALSQLERARETEVSKITDIRGRMRVAELKADENAATIKPVSPAVIPEKQSSPNPYIIFTAGSLLGMLFGIFCVLVLDHLEDKLVGVVDVEQRLHLKALAVFPHLRRKQRAQVALSMHVSPFSQYSESMAGLRNLLDSPRYHDLAKVLLIMSTQPAEGKTCTSTNLAIAYAQSGQRTLYVDFDMRRPRVAGIFGRAPDSFQSLPHVLSRNDPSLFPTLPQETQVPNLHVVFSRASNSISPSVLMGTNVITEFFDWARKNYDHVIIDSPPFGLVGDVIVLANLVDGVLLVATPDKTRFGPIQFASRRLSEVGARVLGVVVNNVDFGRWAGFGKYETRYGYTTGTYIPHVSKQAAGKPEDIKASVFKVDPKADTTDGKGATPDGDEKPVDDAFTADDE